MAVEPLPGYVIYAGERARWETCYICLWAGKEDRLPHDVADEIEHRHPDHRAHDIPQGDKQLFLLALHNRAVNVVADHEQANHHQYIQGPDQFSVLAALREPVRQR